MAWNKAKLGLITLKTYSQLIKLVDHHVLNFRRCPECAGFSWLVPFIYMTDLVKEVLAILTTFPETFRNKSYLIQKPKYRAFRTMKEIGHVIILRVIWPSWQKKSSFIKTHLEPLMTKILLDSRPLKWIKLVLICIELYFSPELC